MTAAPRTFRIAAIPADGVGKEVVAAGRAVLDALAETSKNSATPFAFAWEDFPWGCDFYERTGKMIDDDGLEQLKDFDAIYFGAVGWPTVPDHVSLWGLRLKICQNFDQWANVRPVHFLPGVQSPCARPTTPSWTGSSSERTARASTRASAAATSPPAGTAVKSPSSRPCSPRWAASGSCGSHSTWPAPGRTRRSPR